LPSFFVHRPNLPSPWTVSLARWPSRRNAPHRTVEPAL
jgi:hypothetical protein